MFFKDTLYVRPRTSLSVVKHAIHNLGVLADTVYPVYHIETIGDNVHFGVVCEHGYMYYSSSYNWFIVDSKTKQLVKDINKPKEVTNANSN